MSTYNVKCLFYGADLQPISPAHLTVDEETGLISEVGRGFVADAEALNFKTMAVLPGFISAHVHIADSAFKDVGLHLKLEELVAPPAGVKHKLLTQTPKRELVEAMRSTARYMLSTGVVAFADFREGGVDGVKLLREAMEGLTVKPIALGRPSQADFTKRELEEILTISDGFGLQDLFELPTSALMIVAELAYRSDKIIVAHALEGYEVPEEGFEEVIKLSRPTALVHMTKASQEQLQIARERDISIICCPRSNAFFGVGLPPIKKMIKSGLNVALGTDNVAWSNPNLFREMEFAFSLLKASFGDPREAGRYVLKMVTVNAARALNMESRGGSIEEGKTADLVFINLEDPNLSFSHNTPATIARRCESENIKLVLKNGKVIFSRLPLGDRERQNT